MFANTHYKRWIVSALLGSTLLALAAPAFADGRRRYKGVRSSASQRVVVRERSSSAAPVLAGLIGGFILGAAVTSSANSRQVVVQDDGYYPPPRRVYQEPSYRYYDPYGDDWYDSLDQCEFRSGGPQVIFVIDVSSGQRVRSLRHSHGRWVRDDSYYASYDHGRRYRDDRWDRKRRHHDDDDDRRGRKHRGHDRDDD